MTEESDQADDQLVASAPSADTPVLHYARPPLNPKRVFTRLLKTMIHFAIGWFLFFMLIYSSRLDRGDRSRRCAADFVAYALVVTIILVRRTKSLTSVDLAFIGFGYPLFVCVTEPFFS